MKQQIPMIYFFVCLGRESNSRSTKLPSLQPAIDQATITPTRDLPRYQHSNPRSTTLPALQPAIYHATSTPTHDLPRYQHSNRYTTYASYIKLKQYL
jgi:hypothetical protein